VLDCYWLPGRSRHNSPDFISATVARDIARALPPSVEAVLVTHIKEIDELERLLQESEITTVQLDSEIPPSSVEGLRGRLPHLKIFKSVSVISADSVVYPEAFEQSGGRFRSRHRQRSN
jgi:phosphoribosylanthranilate isomerase